MSRIVNSKNLFLFSVLLLLVSCNRQSATSEVNNPESTIYLVRHAEKVTNMKDPGLTDQGKERAYFLVEYLKNVKIDKVFSTDRFRTRLTAQPTASSRNLEIQLYDASDLQLFSEELKKDYAQQNLLVVGHSNTTPNLANFLCPEVPLETIGEWEYDKIFRVDFYKDGKCNCEKLKFGRSSIEN